MPELPEVETLRRSLEPSLVGARISAVDVLWKRSIGLPGAELFAKSLLTKRIVRCGRRAKFLVFELDHGECLITHLRMSGDLRYCTPDEGLEKHLRVRIFFENGHELRFIDTRKFGRMYLASDTEQVLGKLGPEPLDEHFSAETLARILSQTSRAIKSALLDQRLVAGLGNIYATEALWHAKIHPLCPARRIERSLVTQLHAAIRDVLRRAVQAGGTDLGDGVWLRGGFETFAYGLASKPCSRCGTTLKLLVIGQRRTDYCPRCQNRRPRKHSR